MEGYLSEQQCTFSLIKKVGINYKKQSKSRITKGYLEARINTLDEYWQTFRAVHFQIVKLATKLEKEEHEYFTEDIFGQGEEEYIIIKADLSDTLENLTSTVYLGTSVVQPSGMIHREEVKLPKVNLPQFGGDYHEWTSFRDLYTTLIHDKITLSKVQKLHYLKSSVTGEAAQLLKHIQITEMNYDVAWETLNKRYNNKRMIVNTILNRLMHQKKIVHGSSKAIKDLLDTTLECLNSLKNNGVDIKNWDIIIIYIILNKLDEQSHRQWEEEIGTLPVEELPELKKFTDFLETRFRVLEMVTPSIQSKDRVLVRPKSFFTSTSSMSTEYECAYCKQNHLIFTCKEFIKLDVNERVHFVQNNRLCFNCLSTNHAAKYCKSKISCQRCRKRHHSLLHYTNPLTENRVPVRATTVPSDNTMRPASTSDNTTNSEIPTLRTCLVTQGRAALMATALINIKTGSGFQLVRALLDPCSQESFISESTVQRLQLLKKPAEGLITGIGQMSTRIKYATDIEIYSRLNNDFKRDCTAFVVKDVTDIMPTEKINYEKWAHIQHLILADPTYHTPGNIDMLLGVNIYTEVLMSGVIRGEPGSPIAQQTSLGWILSGGLLSEGKREIKTMHLNVTLENMIEKFWETERLESEMRNTLTPQEVRAELIYDKTLSRDSSGRYIVSLPFKTDVPNLPTHSREIALKRYNSTERRLSANPEFREAYNEVMREYLTLRHMELVERSEKSTESQHIVYLPHHAVVREDKDTTKIRVVFDASSKGANGVSLNDGLLVGPSLQEELRDILMRWRMHKFCFVTDVIKMYRQILVKKEHTECQRIIWRFNPEEEIKEYRLLTVTFGTACAPYLAIKTLQQIAKDEAHREEFALARKIIENDFYMDDALSGGETEEIAIEAKKQLIEVLRKGGFELQKWSSNSKKFMNTIQPEKRAKSFQIDINAKETIKTLGITWNTNQDKLLVANNINILPERRLSKRNVLSIIASLFDPMGWLAPSVIMAKIFMQKLWLQKLTWDEELPEDLKQEWLKFYTEIESLKHVKLERWIGTTSTNQLVELHGFADASMAAYAAVVYSRVIQANGEVKISLIMAKTKVAPLKQLSLPRLELSAAYLLSKLLKHIATAMQIENKNTYAWSDSKVVLAWIHGDPNKWTPFVKNRVIAINTTIETTWTYVNTKENPADPASRGVLPGKLKDNALWLQGPTFLRGEWRVPTYEIEDTDLEKRRIVKCANTAIKNTEEEFIFTLARRFSSLRRLIAVVAYCRRWLHLKEKSIIKHNLPAFVTTDEREEALTVCIKLAQQLEFPDEIECLRKGKQIKNGSRLLAFNPFLDSKGVMRVGGRLKHADLEFLRKHPIIISKNNVLIRLLLHEAHQKTLHGGPQLMTTYLRAKYWLINAGNTVKSFVRNCMPCAKLKAITRTQLMGNLPEMRVKPSRPFLISGVDFAGPINVRMSQGRGSKSHKAYISLFICMVTKAMHIECVSNMTTEAFMAAFRRFVSRRGYVKEMWSDHGTTFIAAGKELLDTWKQGKKSIPDELALLLDTEGTKWRYIPPRSPNHGGLWEAGIKSIKFHLKRIIGDTTPTFEELSTLLTQIEACLNSRPLSPFSDHPDDLEPLTPAHFLVGEPLTTIPEEELTQHNPNSLSRWKSVQRMLQAFWKKWQSEYLTRLQERPKWKSRRSEFEIGELVLVKDHQLPPSKWLLGRIVQKYPGRDNLTRTYDVRTTSGVYTRTTSKLCALPDVTKDNVVLSAGVC